MCNEITWVLVFSCQIAGIPTRIVFMFTDPPTHAGGHAVTEIYFNGKWNLVENNQGVMFCMDDGYFASAMELRNAPFIVNSRPDVGGGFCPCHAADTGPMSTLRYSIDNTDHHSCATHPLKQRRCDGAQAVPFARVSQSFMNLNPAGVREYPPLNFSLTSSSLSVRSSSVASSCSRFGPEKHNIWPGVIKNCRKVRNTRCSDVDSKILAPTYS